MTYIDKNLRPVLRDAFPSREIKQGHRAAQSSRRHHGGVGAAAAERGFVGAVVGAAESDEDAARRGSANAIGKLHET